MGSNYNAYIYGHYFITPHPGYFALLQYAQQLGLQVDIQLTNFI